MVTSFAEDGTPIHDTDSFDAGPIKKSVPQVQTYEQIMTTLGQYGRIAEVKKNIWVLRAKMILGFIGIGSLVIISLGLVIMFFKLVLIALAQ